MTPDEISAYLSASLPPERRSAVAQHLAACDDCRRDLIGASRALEREGRRRWTMITLASAAAAALVLLFVVPGDGPNVLDPQAPVVRTGPTEAVRTLVAVSPEDGARVAADSVRFEWQSEGPQARYRLTVTDEIGDVVWEESTNDTVLELPPELAVVPGAAYFWRVDALLQGAQSSTTGFRSFVVIDP